MFDLRYHLALVTNYRRKALPATMRERLKEILAATLVKWRCELVEFGGESDHVHLLFSAHPALDISNLVAAISLFTLLPPRYPGGLRQGLSVSMGRFRNMKRRKAERTPAPLHAANLARIDGH